MIRERFSRASLCVALTLVAVFAAAAKARSEDPISLVATESDARPHAATFELWLVSSRNLAEPCGQCGPLPALDVRHFTNGVWQSSSVDAFHATNHEHAVTCIYVHGNRMTNGDAVVHGNTLMRHLRCCSVPFRLIIWSWPSDRMYGPARDVRLKEKRADRESYYLAHFLATFGEGSSVQLIGYSLGARPVVGSLQLLAGGMMHGNRLPDSTAKAPHPTAVLIAAAFPSGWLLPGGTCALAIGQAHQVVSFFNPKDPALLFYRLASQHGRVSIMGRHGLSERPLGDAACLLEQYNVGESVGKTHDFDDYVASSHIVRTISEHLTGAAFH